MEFEYLVELLISVTLGAVVWTLKEVHQIRVDMARWITTTETINKTLAELGESVVELGERVEALARQIAVVELNGNRIDEAVQSLDDWMGRLAQRVAALEGAADRVITQRRMPKSPTGGE